MCGVYFRRDFVCANEIEEYDRINLNKISHRGPDSSTLVNFQKNIVGFNRLGIRDLLGGFQPYTGKFNDFIACINGELFNQDLLEQKLKDEFPTLILPTGDMQIMAEFISKFGELALNDVDGMFAGFIFKPSSNTLLLFRDKVGEKPLYFKLDKKGIMVSSETRPLLSLENIFDFEDSKSIIRGFWAETTSCYSGIAKVPAGTYVKINLESKDIKYCKYWGWPGTNFNHSKIAEKNHIGDIADSLSESVRKQLVADVPIALYLSGGLDSALVLGLSKRHSQREIDSLTLDFEGSQFSEKNLAAKTASFFGSKHTVIDLSSTEMANLIPEVLQAMDTPILDPACIGVYALSKVASDLGFKVALSGDGGDELFRGYGIYSYTKYLSALTAMPTVSKSLLKLIISSGVGQNRYLGIQAFAKRALDLLSYSDLSIPELALSPLSGSSLIRDLLGDNSTGPRRYVPIKILNLEFEKYYREQILPELYLVKSDRMSMRHSIELRNPLLDGEILRKIHNLYDQGVSLPKKNLIISSIIGQDFPTEISTAKKQGFSIPISTALPHMNEPEWNLNKLGIKDESARQLWRTSVQGDASQTHAVWALIVLNHFINR